MGWIVRKAIGMMTIGLNIKEYKEDGVTHIDVEQPGAAGIKGTTELRTLDGSKRDHEDHIFGHVVGTTKWIKLDGLNDADADEAFLKKDWDTETAAGDLVDSFVENSKNGWTARQIWGFQTVQVEGQPQRRYVRNVVVKKVSSPTHTLCARLLLHDLAPRNALDGASGVVRGEADKRTFPSSPQRLHKLNVHYHDVGR